MSVDRKTLTENPIIDEIIYNGQLLMKGCILKDLDEANKYETMESIKRSDFYIACIEERISYGAFRYTKDLIKQVGNFTESELDVYQGNNSIIPDEYKPQLLNLRRLQYIEEYEELNDYYRMLNGLPNYNQGGIYITADDVGGKRSDTWKNVKKIAYLPIHEWPIGSIDLLEIRGYLDKIKEDHPDDKYLNFIGNKSISIYTARKAERFECLYLPNCPHIDIQNHFFTLLDKNRIVFNRTLYSYAYRFESEYYDKFLIVMIIIQSFCDMIDEYAYYIIRRDVFDIRTIRYLFEAHGIKFFPDIPFKYQLSLVRNINKLLKYKSTDKIIVDICSLFGFNSVQLFKWYILKDRKIDQSKDDYKYIKDVTEKWTETHIPWEYKDYTSIAYGNERFIALNETGLHALFSMDLINWYRYELPGSMQWKDIMYYNKQFIGLGDMDVTWSLNGKTWLHCHLPNPYDVDAYKAITYGRNLYVIISDKGVLYSSKTTEWNYAPLPEEFINANGKVSNIYFFEDKFFSFTSKGILYSEYGSRNWNLFPISEFNNKAFERNCATYADNHILVLANEGSNSNLYCVDDLNNIITIKTNLPAYSHFKYCVGKYVITSKGLNNSIYTFSQLDETPNAIELNNIPAQYGPIAYGDNKFFVLGDNGKGFYYTRNNTSGIINDDEDGNPLSTTIYNNDDNYELKFIRSKIEDDAVESLTNPNNIYDYYNIITQDKYWEGDQTRDKVRKSILDMEFNILQTKYYSLESITEITDMSFQLSYFMNIIMNNDLTDALTLSLPFVGGGNFRIIDVFVFLYALGYAYYGTRDDIMNKATNVLTIRAFNFEVDLAALSAELYEKGYDLNELCGDVFLIPENGILTYKELLYVYTHNKEIYEHITKQMIHCDNKDIYDILKQIYDALFIADLNMKNFSVLDDDGNIIYTYATFTEYLYEKNIDLYNYLINLKSIKNDDERREAISNCMNDVVSYIEEGTSLLDSSELDYLWTGLPTLSIDFIKIYITHLILFFKSFKAQLLNISTLYKIADPYDNMIWVIDRMHFDYFFEWSLIYKLLEQIELDVDMTKKDKVLIRDNIYKMIRYTLKSLSLDDSFRLTIKDLYRLITHLYKTDNIPINDKIDKFMIKAIHSEDIYFLAKYYRKYFYTHNEEIGTIERVIIQPYILDEENHSVEMPDPKEYTSNKKNI